MVIASPTMLNGRRRLPIVRDLSSNPKLTQDHPKSRDAAVKKRRKALVKRAEWSHLDFSTFTVKIARSLVNPMHKSATTTGSHSSSTSAPTVHGTKKKHSKSKENVLRIANGKGERKVSWKTPLNHTEKKRATAKEDKDDQVKSFQDSASNYQSPSSCPQDLVQALIERPGMPRTVDQNGPQIQNPHDHDVILGNGSMNHFGNIAYRVFVWKSQKDYASKTNRHDKANVVERVLQNVLSREPPGRFLEQVHGTDHYVDVPVDRIRTKIGHALRELHWVPPTDLLQRLQHTSNIQAMDVTKRRPNGETTCMTIDVSKGSKLLPDVVTSHPVHGHIPKTTASVKTATKKKSSASCATTKSIDHTIGAGSRLAMYWPLDKVYYNATVLERIHNCVSLVYDDEETEWIDLTKHKFRVLSFGM